MKGLQARKGDTENQDAAGIPALASCRAAAACKHSCRAERLDRSNTRHLATPHKT